MHILMPDAQFDDNAKLEHEIFGEDNQLVVMHERDPAAIPDEIWEQAMALIVHIDMAINDEVIRRLSRCRIIVRAGVGYDHIDLEAAGRRGIPVCNVPDYGTLEVADHAIALMLGLVRGLVPYHQRLLADPVAGWNWSGVPLVRRISKTCFGIVGLGRIGMAAARRARGLDMEVAFYDPHLPDGIDLATGYRREHSLHDLLAVADVVSMHCPLSPSTHGMIGAEAFKAMRPNAVLINTARGALVDLDALETALRSGRLDGAGLDVLPHEPPDAEHPLISAFRRREPWLDGRLLLTPHAAWFSPSGRADLRRKSAKAVIGFLKHGKRRNLVNAAYLRG